MAPGFRWPSGARRAAPLPHLYATVGNVIVAGIALLAGGGHLVLGWRGFWSPLAGDALWVAGSHCAFRASETIVIARVAGTWTPLNIIVAFACGALLFGELDHFSGIRFVLIAIALAAVLAGILLIVSSGARVVPADPPAPQAIETEPAGRPPWRAACRGQRLRGLHEGVTSACAVGRRTGAGKQLPVALGILSASVALVLPAGGQARLGLRALTVQLGADVLFGIGDITVLGLVSGWAPGPAHHCPAQLAGQRQHRHLGLPRSRAGYVGGEEGHRRHRDRRAGGCVIGAMRQTCEPPGPDAEAAADHGARHRYGPTPRPP